MIFKIHQVLVTFHQALVPCLSQNLACQLQLSMQYTILCSTIMFYYRHFQMLPSLSTKGQLIPCDTLITKEWTAYRGVLFQLQEVPKGHSFPQS